MITIKYGGHMATLKLPGAGIRQALTRVLCLLLALPILAPTSSYALTNSDIGTQSEAYQAADILSIRPQVERLLLLQRDGGGAASKTEILSLRALVLRKLLLGFLEVRRASNKTDIELAYAYDIMYRDQHKQAAVFQTLTLLNFAQLSVFFTIEPYARINKQFKKAHILGEVSSGLGLALPIASVLYGKYHKLGDITPPKFFTNVLDGAPVDASGLPDLVDKFLDSPEPGEPKSRKELMFEFWRKDYHVDPSNKATLAGINDGKSKSPFVLNTRQILLWSLRNHIQDFDHELAALGNLVRTSSPPSSDANIASVSLSRGALEAARLLRIDAPVAELIGLNRGNVQNEPRLELESYILEKVLAGTLDVRIGTDKVDQELHYSHDIVLDQLLAARGQALQQNFEANFIQNGSIDAVAHYLFLKGYPKAGNELFVISDAIGTCLSTLALVQTHGGRRDHVGGPNSLADLFELQPSLYHFSPLISEFLNSPSTESTTGQTRKEFLHDIWKKTRISTMNLDSQKNRHKLAAMPDTKYDTIKIATNRVSLLQSLKANLEFFDGDLLELMQQTGLDSTRIEAGDVQNSIMTVSAAQAARLIGVQASVNRLVSIKHDNGSQAVDTDLLSEQLGLTRKILQAMLEVRVTADRLDLEIIREQFARDKMERSKDFGIAITNNANFFQLGILGMITSGLGLTDSSLYMHEGDVLNVVSGYLVGGLTAASFLQQQYGGYRPSSANPNLLGQLLGLDTAADNRFSPLIWSFLNSPNPVLGSDMTRRERLFKYWKETKVVSLNPSNHAQAERVAATGSAHHWWSETIKLINNRLNMMYGVRATVDLFDIGLSELLVALD
jgi:hypothetical protein